MFSESILQENINEFEVQTISTSKKKYIIEPGGGANWAEVIIDYENFLYKYM